ncbi:MAG: hypothetical protein K2I53_03535 [Lachnospiraceae bacterium]|nr:hypothetical protein [Lachnospiraceae bacterium]
MVDGKWRVNMWKENEPTRLKWWKERYDMCKAFEDMKQESFEKGIEKGIRVLIQTCKELGISDQVIIEKCAEKYEMTKEAVGRYMKG